MPYNLCGMTEYDLSPKLRERIDAALEDTENLVLVTFPRWSWGNPTVLLFIVFGVFWLTIVSLATVSMVTEPSIGGFECLFMIPFWVVGVGIVAGLLIYRARVLRTVYLITDKRAVVLRPSAFFRPKVLFWPLKPDMVKAVNERRGGYGDIVLGYKSYQVNNQPAPDGLLNVPEVRRVLSILQEQLHASGEDIAQLPMPQSAVSTPAEVKKNARVKCLMGVLFACFGAVFCGAGIMMHVQQQEVLQHGVKTEATVVKLHRSEDSDGNTSYFPVVQFTDANGQELTVRGTWSNCNVSKGDKVSIIYLPSRPDDFEIEGHENPLLPYAFIIMGGVVVVVGIGFFIYGLIVRKKQL